LSRKVVTYPDAVLKKKTQPIERITEEVFKIVEEMTETMLKEDGVGLAANQIASLMRVFVLNITPREENPTPVAFINPEIIDKKDPVVDEEGCLSFPGLYLKISRANVVRVHARNLYNEDTAYEMTGLLARAIQHELDHLNGIVFIDRAEKEDEEKIRDYLAKIESCIKTK
jgi:peptide deformylase